jgi:hypothetical protein
MLIVVKKPAAPRSAYYVDVSIWLTGGKVSECLIVDEQTDEQEIYESSFERACYYCMQWFW